MINIAYAAAALRDIVVALTNNPSVTPSPASYSVCGTYAGVLPSVVNITCQFGTSAGRYLVIQAPFTNTSLTLCQVQVYIDNIRRKLNVNTNILFAWRFALLDQSSDVSTALVNRSKAIDTALIVGKFKKK